MTWAEFRLRSFAYRRIRKRELFDLRELMWTIYWSGYQNPKRMKKTKRAFWDLEKGSRTRGPSDTDRRAILAAQERYRAEVEAAKNKKIENE